MSAEETVGKILAENDFGDIHYEKMTYSRSSGTYALYLSSDSRLSGKAEAELKEKTSRGLMEHFPSVKVYISQPAESVLEDDEAFSSAVKKLLLKCEPALVPFVKGCSVRRSGANVDIEFDREVAPDIVRTSGAADAVESVFEAEYGRKIRIRELSFVESDLARDKKYVPSEELLIKREPQSGGNAAHAQQSEAPRAAKKPAPAGASVSAPMPEGVVYGKRISGAPAAMRDIEQNAVSVIEGDVISTEVRTVKDGRFTIAIFNITDRTTTLRCKIFIKGNCADEIESKLKGARLRVKGKLEEDNFSKGFNGRPETIFNVTDANKAERTKKLDNAPEKRVELHLHTNMSSMDAITSAADYVKRAAEWGHKAVAITDHGVVQAFPDAQSAGSKYGVKIIYGMEAYVFDDEKPVYDGRTLPLDGRFTVFDIETTGLNSQTCGITEIGAVRIEGGKITDRFSTFVNPGMKIPPNIVTLTGITDEMVADAPSEKEAVSSFLKFAGDDCLAAHNAKFDMGFIAAKCMRDGIEFKNEHFDTLEIARIHLNTLTSHKLDKLCAHYGITLHHHRAVNDAEATAEVVLRMFSEMGGEGIKTLNELNGSKKKSDKNTKTKHTIILAKNKKGLSNLYKLVSAGHIDYFYRKPRIPKSLVTKLREGLIIGSACCDGELFGEIIDGASEEKIEKTAAFYDYLEIQPVDNNAFLIREGRFANKDQLRDINRRIFELAKKLGKPVAATCDCHFLEPEDEMFRRIVMDSLGFKDCDTQPPLYYRTTEEMLEEFSYLGEEGAYDAVVKYPNMIAGMTEEIELFPKDTAMPFIENADKDITEAAYEKMYGRYGSPLPENIKQRLEKELNSIIKHGYAVLYWIAMNLVKKSNGDGYLVGSRGSVGSSLAAYATGITEVNPLPPHYICPNCQHSDFDIDVEKYACGVDMPKAVCPICGTEYESDGYDIPFEVFLGFNADKVPDIDLNFSGEYQPNAHKYIEEVFGENFVFRAGTISAIKEKTAEGFVRKYMEKRGLEYTRAEISRLAIGMTGVKRTTGQHPGGVVIVPKDREIYEFTAIQKPANDMSVESTTTHFDFNSMHDKLIKLDILGHDNPTMIRELQNTIGFDPLTIPLNDRETLSLFSSTKALGVEPEDIMGVKVGTLGIPEFGTKFVRGMLVDTKPETMSELIRISGLSHGTNVWNDNADQLIASGQARLKDAICTRDDIMTTLIRYGADKKMSFDIMESVRKGKWAKHKEGRQEEMEKAIADAGAPEWFAESCRKIGYMFPKAHAVAYVIMALRIAYCKVHHPADYYAAYFTVRGTDFDANYSINGMESIIAAMKEIKAKESRSATDDDALTNLEIAQEMYARGIAFLPVDLKKSRAKRYVIEDGNIRLPFLSVPKLGEKAAENLERIVDSTEILSIDELKNEAKLSSSVIEAMRTLGCLNGLSESSQLSIFDIM